VEKTLRTAVLVLWESRGMRVVATGWHRKKCLICPPSTWAVYLSSQRLCSVIYRKTKLQLEANRTLATQRCTLGKNCDVCDKNKFKPRVL